MCMILVIGIRRAKDSVESAIKKANCIFFVILPSRILFYSVLFRTFAADLKHGQVLYGQLPVNPPGLDRSKGSRL